MNTSRFSPAIVQSLHDETSLADGFGKSCIGLVRATCVGKKGGLKGDIRTTTF